MSFLTRAVADLNPTDPRHEAAYAVVEQLQPDWDSRVDRVCGLPAESTSGLVAKAALLDTLLERDEHDAVQGGPALRLAASLVTDLLAYEWS